MKKILFCDDDSSRHSKFFQTKEQGDELRQVWNAADCIEALKEGRYDLVSLDHDLNGEAYQNPTEKNTGSEVVRFITANKPDVKEFVVHSYNEFAAKNMVEDLQKAGYRVEWSPFSL